MQHAKGDDFMIFYFTGTGNSLYLAKRIADEQGEKLISIAKELDKKDNSFRYELKDNETLGFVYPVYAWAPPKKVLDFAKKIRVEGGTPYVFSLSTCGAEEGGTTGVLEKALSVAGLILSAAFTVLMPNNYILGYDVDTKEVEKKVLAEAEEKLIRINRVISARKKDRSLLLAGKMAALKTVVVNPLFNRFAMDTGKFHVDDTCTGCGLCEKICPAHTIKVSGRPEWGRDCTQCLACINRCPVKAIQYGKSTAQKGRYFHPQITELEKSVEE
jgi:NAD-dependent dihydropyrimidine dehydrogenase PreA subunit